MFDIYLRNFKHKYYIRNCKNIANAKFTLKMLEILCYNNMQFALSFFPFFITFNSLMQTCDIYCYLQLFTKFKISFLLRSKHLHVASVNVIQTLETLI